MYFELSIEGQMKLRCRPFKEHILKIIIKEHILKIIIKEHILKIIIKEHILKIIIIGTY